MKLPRGQVSILAMLVLYPWFIFTAVFGDHWFLSLIIPCSCIVLWRFKYTRQNIWYYIASAAACLLAVWNNMSGCENEGLLKEFDRQKPPAASMYTPYHINTHVHTCTHPHMFCQQKVTLQSSSELQSSQHLHLTHLCQGSDDWHTRHPSPSLPLPLPLMCPKVIPACIFHIGERRRGRWDMRWKGGRMMERD